MEIWEWRYLVWCDHIGLGHDLYESLTKIYYMMRFIYINKWWLYMGDLNPECLIDSFRLDRGLWYTMGEVGVAFLINMLYMLGSRFGLWLGRSAHNSGIHSFLWEVDSCSLKGWFGAWTIWALSYVRKEYRIYCSLENQWYLMERYN